MGYDVHITRKTFSSSEEEEAEITLAEWEDYVLSDLELEMDPDSFDEVVSESGNVMLQWDGSALWNPSSRQDGYVLRFNEVSGNVYAKNPRTEVVKKMYQIAEKLNAQVQGDDGEYYDSEGNGIMIPRKETFATKIWKWVERITNIGQDDNTSTP